jgi:hypothetical protein
MKPLKFSLESLLFLLAFLLALALRLFHLGAVPLSESEANLALQALAIAGGKHVAIPGQPGYIILTSVIFYLFGNSDFLARFVPAITGSLFVLAPLLYRRHFGKPLALGLAFALALDPGLVAISKQASGEILSMVFTFAAIGFLLQRKSIWTGVFTALAIFSGISFWFGALILAIALILSKVLKKSILPETDEQAIGEEGWSWLSFALSGMLTLLVVSTAFWTVPQGLNAVFSGLSEYFLGWFSQPQTSLKLLLAGLSIYELFPLLLALLALVVGLLRGSEVPPFFFYWTAAALLLIFLYPGRQLAYMAWVIIPLWVIGIHMFLQFPLPMFKEDRLPLGGIGALAFVALIFAWMNFSGLGTLSVSNTADLQLRLVSLAGSLILISLAVVLISWGWSWYVAANGIFYSFALLLGLFTISMSWHAAGLGQQPESELLPNSYFRDADILNKSVRDISFWNTGQDNTLDVYVVNISSKSLQWTFRDFSNLHLIDSIPTDANYPVIITPQRQELSLASAYTGQDFVYSESSDWSTMQFYDWLGWTVRHQTPKKEVSSILWVRSDLFPGAEAIAQPQG